MEGKWTYVEVMWEAKTGRLSIYLSYLKSYDL